MKKAVGGIIVAALLVVGLGGCTLKMGNTQAGLLEGWNQPSVQSQKTETINPVIMVPAPAQVK